MGRFKRGAKEEGILATMTDESIFGKLKYILSIELHWNLFAFRGTQKNYDR